MYDIVSFFMRNNIDTILDFYNKKESRNLKKRQEPTPNIVVNYNGGIGDTLTTLCLHKSAEEQGLVAAGIAPVSSHFHSLKSLSGMDIHKNQIPIDVEDIQFKFDFGNGNLFQRIQRACGLKPKKVAKAFLGNIPNKEKSKICISFDVGGHAANQKHIHPKARQLYPEHFNSVQSFINKNKDKYRFVEVGLNSFGFDGVESKCSKISLKETIEEISTSEYFLGMHSGLMHIASSFDVKCIIFLNFPSAVDVVLPVLKNVDIVDLEWLDPRHVYLHEDNESTLVKKVSEVNIEKAINGELFPYWKYDHLDLIDDAI